MHLLLTPNAKVRPPAVATTALHQLTVFVLLLHSARQSSNEGQRGVPSALTHILLARSLVNTSLSTSLLMIVFCSRFSNS